ncbi:MAG TPA: hypothetical protein VF905_02240 [Nitrospirota bacterium]
MKKLILLIALLLLSSCMTVRRAQDSEEKEAYIILKSGKYLVDMCDEENMPRFTYRPKLKASELENLSDKEMDERIKKHIKALEAHIDQLETVIIKTRQRVEVCRSLSIKS